MQTTPYNLEQILKEFSIDELENIVFKDEDDFDSFLTLSEVTPLPFPKPPLGANNNSKNPVKQ